MLLQEVRAAAVVREGSNCAGPWLEVGDAGARATVVLAVLALVAALAWLHRRVALVVATAIFAPLVFAESHLGGEIGRYAWLQSAHFPLAMVLLAVALHLPLAHRRSARTSAS